ncbi:MAG: tetratricopeptide repeat protein [Anaerolineales bacterium]
MPEHKPDSPKKPRRTKKENVAPASPKVQVQGNATDTTIIAGDHNKVETKNIFQFFTQTFDPKQLVLFAVVLIVGIGVLLFGLYHAYFRYDRAIASGQLNVFIVPFLEEKPWGYMNSDLGWNIAQIFTDGAKQSFEEKGLNSSITILGPSDKVPPFQAVTERQLNHEAETLSEKVNGQIVIYGVVTKDEYGDPIVSLKVYISPTNFGEAQELISDSMMGELSLGSFRLTGDTVSGADLLAQNKELRDRLQIFASLINFLGAYVGEDFSHAQAYLEQASDPALWSDPNGLEVIHLLQGNMELRHARVLLVAKDLDGVHQSIELAREQFNTALSLAAQNGKGRYVRAYLGLAGVESLAATAEAYLKKDGTLIDTSALEQAIKNLDLASQADYIPETADVNTKVNYSKAQIHLSYFAKTGETSHLSEAKGYYQKVIDEYQKSGNKRIKEYAALSYSGLAHIAFQEQRFEDSAKAFLTAQELTVNPSLKVQCLVGAGDAYFSLKNYDLALKYYQDALLRKKDLEKAISSERLSEIEKRIQFIKGGGSL